jgi:ABC-type amino acid transport substrate-binding protein
MRKRTFLALLGAVLVAVLVVGATTGCGSKSSGKKKITIDVFPADTNAAIALQTGKVDAYVADATPVLYYMKKNPGKFEIAGKQLDTTPEGIATRKGDALGNSFEQAIAKLYATGEMQKILAKWGLSEFALPNPPSAPASLSVPNLSGYTLNFCTDTTYPPMESLENGKAVGADIDIGNAIVKLWGKKAEFSTTGFDVLIPALQANKCDAIISALSDTPERAKEVDFADYVSVGTLIMVQKGNPADITDLASLSGKTVAVQAATTQKDMLDAENAKLAKSEK